MATENTWDQTAYNEEVGLPARGALSGAAITRRAANYLCFANSKTLFRKVLRELVRVRVRARVKARVRLRLRVRRRLRLRLRLRVHAPE